MSAPTQRLPVRKLLTSARWLMAAVGLYLAASSAVFAWILPQMHTFWHLQPDPSGDWIRGARAALGGVLIALALALPKRPKLLAALAVELDVAIEAAIYGLFPHTFHVGESLAPQLVILVALIDCWLKARTYERLRNEDAGDD